MNSTNQAGLGQNFVPKLGQIQVKNNSQKPDFFFFLTIYFFTRSSLLSLSRCLRSFPRSDARSTQPEQRRFATMKRPPQQRDELIGSKELAETRSLGPNKLAL
jgi:hypothetical protein